MGTVTITNKKVYKLLNKTIVKGQLAFSASYATGGETVPLAQLGLERLDFFDPANKGGYLLEPSLGTTNKVKARIGNYDAALATRQYFEINQEEISASNKEKVYFTFSDIAPTGTSPVVHFIAPFAGDITSVRLIMGVAGSSGDTTIDVLKGRAGTTIFSTKPTVGNAESDGTEDVGVINLAADDFVSGDVIELKYDEIAGSGDDLIITIEFTPTDRTGVIAHIRAPFAGDITDVVLLVGTTGTSGSTTIDVNKGIGGTSIFTTEPTLLNSASDGDEDNGTIDTTADDFVAGDIIEVVIDAFAIGSANMLILIEFTPTTSQDAILVEVTNGTDLSTPLGIVDFTAWGIGLVAED